MDSQHGFNQTKFQSNKSRKRNISEGKRKYRQKYKYRIIIPINNRITLSPPLLSPARNNTANLFARAFKLFPFTRDPCPRINFQKRVQTGSNGRQFPRNPNDSAIRLPGRNAAVEIANRWSKFLSIIGQFREAAVNRRHRSNHVFAKRPQRIAQLRMKLIRQLASTCHEWLVQPGSILNSTERDMVCTLESEHL